MTTTVDSTADSAPGPGAGSRPGPGPGPTPDDDRAVVARLLGRAPQGTFEVVVRRDDGTPVVLANEPLLDSGRPMPTRYWLVDRALSRAVGQLESEGGVNRAEAEVDPAALRGAHAAYAAERDARIGAGHDGPRPSGGVGGTRIGVKCLHAHLANLLVGNDDPVGRWVEDHLRARGVVYDPAEPASWPAGAAAPPGRGRPDGTT